MRLYYISTSNQLAISVSFGGSWTSNSELSTYTTSQSTRQLSLTSNLDTTNASELFENETVNQSLLLFENSLGNVTALLKIRQPCAIGASDCVVQGAEGNFETLSWLDISKNNKSVPQSVFSPFYYNYGGQSFDQVDGEVISSTLYELSPGELKLSTPFAGQFSYPVDDSDPQVRLLICNNSQPVEEADTSRCNSMVNIDYTSWSNSSHGAFFIQGMYLKSSNSVAEITILTDYFTSNVSGINDSDLAMIGSNLNLFAIGVRGTEPVVLGSTNQSPAPQAPFPFKRVASIINEDQTASFLYHQINGTTFAEEQFITSLNSWAPPTYITIPNLT